MHRQYYFRLLFQTEAVEELQATQQKMGEWENMMQLLQDDRDRLEAELATNERRETQAVQELDDLNSSLQVHLYNHREHIICSDIWSLLRILFVAFQVIATYCKTSSISCCCLLACALNHVSQFK